MADRTWSEVGSAIAGAFEGHLGAHPGQSLQIVKCKRQLLPDAAADAQLPRTHVDVRDVPVDQQVVHADRRDVVAERLEVHRVVPHCELELVQRDVGAGGCPLDQPLDVCGHDLSDGYVGAVALRAQHLWRRGSAYLSRRRRSRSVAIATPISPITTR